MSNALAETKAIHTPGPWDVDDVRVFAPAFDSKVAVKDKDGKEVEHGQGMIALVYTPTAAVLSAGCSYDEMHDANARLIAAAPELLTALRDLCDAIPDATVTHDPPLEAWIKQAREVIAKAEGR